ncbi:MULTISPECIES: glycosyltransferase [unclassified Thiocapsa]|uniref:glycosyltransferase n=1 Tax=unclassified Thiocapsa TaxID=2641286 RepID=UPI0035B043DE
MVGATDPESRGPHRHPLAGHGRGDPHHRGQDPDRHHPAHRRRHPDPSPARAPGPFTALYSGNVGRKQGLDQLLDLGECIQQRRLDIRLIIRGDGNDRETLQARAAERRIDSLLFEPLKPEAQLAEGLADSHVHLVPQNPAGAAFALPSKVCAIMAAGRPFICTAASGSPLDQLREASDAFVVCPPNQTEQLAEALDSLILDPCERARIGSNGRAFVERRAGRAVRAPTLSRSAPRGKSGGRPCLTGHEKEARRPACLKAPFARVSGI